MRGYWARRPDLSDRRGGSGGKHGAQKGELNEEKMGPRAARPTWEGGPIR